jgi:hypothetical protein
LVSVTVERRVVVDEPRGVVRVVVCVDVWV